MKIRAKVDCPYCGTHIEFMMEQGATSSQHEVTVCDSTDGGCDKMFVLSSWMIPQFAARALVEE